MSGQGGNKKQLDYHDDLNLPDAPAFISEPPQYTMAEMFEICEKMLPYWNKIRFSKPLPPGPQEEFVLD
jgi:hypothetical protein